MMKRSLILLTGLFLMGMVLGSEVIAEDGSKPYAGDIWSRSTLTGDWGGARNDLAAKGITFDMNLTQVGQGVTDGGKDKSWEYGGRGDLTVNVDTQKLGLWPGGLLTLEFEGNFNDSVNGKTGALSAANTNQLFPTPDGDNLNVPNVSFMQFFSPYAGVVFGKFATITPSSGDMNEFAHGKGDTQFMNAAFNANPAILMTVPYSTLGAGLMLLPTKDPKSAAVNFMVLQGNGQPNTIGFSDLTSEKLVYLGEGRVRTDFFGLTGHQLIGATYSNKEFTSLDQRLGSILENQSLEPKKGSWSIYYNFDQYLYEPKKGSGQGIGFFGRFGASDGNPNPVHYFISAGVGGKGMIPGRPLDRFGVGYYYIDVKSISVQGPFTERKFLRDEQGGEAFYNVALTPWMQVTPNIQVIKGAQKQTFTRTGPVTFDRRDINTDTILGLRVNLVF
jgi:porin